MCATSHCMKQWAKQRCVCVCVSLSLSGFLHQLWLLVAVYRMQTLNSFLLCMCTVRVCPGLLMPGEQPVSGLNSLPYTKLYFQDATTFEVFEELVPGYLLLTNQRLLLLSVTAQTINE